MLVIGHFVGFFNQQRQRKFVINCNLPGDELHEAYVAGVKKLNFDIETRFNNTSSQGNLLLPDDILDLSNAGFDGLDMRYVHPKDGSYELEKIDYLRIWMFIAHAGNPKLEWDFDPEPLEFHIGGEGFYR